jgi:hypothetical protein
MHQTWLSQSQSWRESRVPLSLQLEVKLPREMQQQEKRAQPKQQQSVRLLA